MRPVKRALEPGSPIPLGATFDGAGVNFAVFSGAATAIELCLFDRADAAEATAVYELVPGEAGVFTGYLRGCRPGQRYGLRVHGVFDPPSGRRCNPAKLLVDPYARAIDGRADWRGPILGYPHGHPAGDMAYDRRDSAGSAPKSVVVADDFDWEGDRRPAIPWAA